MLPLASKAFGQYALAVKDGFLAAVRAQGGTSLPVNIYAVGDDPRQTVETYINALGAGARVVVGPLTRNGVTALAESATVMVPTLALNVPDGQIPAVPEFYVLSLHAESEARQVAQLAWQDGRRTTLTVIGETPLLRRIHLAFVEEFTRLGGTVLAPLPFTTDPEGLVRIKKAADAALDTETADMVFIALDLARARLTRPYLSSLPIYATSQVHPGVAGPLVAFDLAGVRFLDMPAAAGAPRGDGLSAPGVRRLHRALPLLCAGHRRLPHGHGAARRQAGLDLRRGHRAAHAGPRFPVRPRPDRGPVQRRQADRPRAPMNRRGEPAEDLAAAFLERQGLRILERNYRCRFGEIDLVARSGALLVFVEVRARRSEAFGGAAGSITAAKRRRLVATARHYLARRGADQACRFDVVLVRGTEQRMEWLTDAFGE
jgi:uncharacterized protein (TIGR00252 family)